MDSGEFDLGMSEISAGDAPYPSKPSKAGDASTRAIGSLSSPRTFGGCLLAAYCVRAYDARGAVGPVLRSS